MSYFEDPESGNRSYIFGQGGAKKLADRENLQFLGEIPLVQSIREGGDSGVPAVLDQNSIVGNIFSDLSDQVARQVLTCGRPAGGEAEHDLEVHRDNEERPHQDELLAEQRGEPGAQLGTALFVAASIAVAVSRITWPQRSVRGASALTASSCT